MKYPSWYSLWNYRNIERLSCRKILTPDVCLKPQMYFDKNGDYYHLDTSYALIAKKEFSELVLPIYLILNSLITWYYLTSVGTVLRGGFFRFKTSYLKNFPLPLKESYPDILSDIAKLRIETKGKGAQIDDVIDALVFELYFTDHMKEKQINILQFIEKDFAEVMQGREFQQLPESEKETIINQLHSRWTHPDNEVRNRIKLFAVRSPDILKPILESR